ncbi:MAG: peptidoglycan editing factor PgeF [Thermoflexales bacterium]
MHCVTCGAIRYYQFDGLRQWSLPHAVFTRLGGVSEGPWASLNFGLSTGDDPDRVHENTRRACATLGLRPERVASSWMEHGNRVRLVRAEDLRQPNHNQVCADALITAERGLALSLRFADCLPVLLFDPSQGAIGIAHAGWRGIVNGVLGETIRAMQRAFGSRPSDMIAGIGPGIGPQRFTVGAEVAGQIQQAAPEALAVWPPDAACPQPRVDLWRAAVCQLQQAGVKEVEVMRVCTASNTDEWFSHRAEGGRTGRFGVVIALD